MRLFANTENCSNQICQQNIIIMLQLQISLSTKRTPNNVINFDKLTSDCDLTSDY